MHTRTRTRKLLFSLFHLLTGIPFVHLLPSSLTLPPSGKPYSPGPHPHTLTHSQQYVKIKFLCVCVYATTGKKRQGCQRYKPRPLPRIVPVVSPLRSNLRRLLERHRDCRHSKLTWKDSGNACSNSGVYCTHISYTPLRTVCYFVSIIGCLFFFVVKLQQILILPL